MMGLGRPKRLRELAPAGSPLARALTAARARQPTPEEAGALEATLLTTLGAVAAAAAATNGAAAAPATAAAKASMSGVPATPVAASIAMKATLLLALGAGAAAGGAGWLRHQRGAPPSRDPAQAHEVARDPEPPAPAGDEVPAPVAPAPLPAAVERSRRAPRLRALDRREPATAVPAITAELKLIERARAALAADPARALELCEAHAHTYATGVMGEERDVMMITALASLDRVSEARAALDGFRRRYPASPHASRLAERLRVSSATR